MIAGFLLDTNVISEFLRVDQTPDANVERWLASLAPGATFTSVVVCGEIQKGIEQLGPGKRRSHLEHWLQHDLHKWFGPQILPVDLSVAFLWGRLTMTAKAKGVQVPVADGLIAATALHHNLTVASRNSRHFTDLGVSVFNPWNFTTQYE